MAVPGAPISLLGILAQGGKRPLYKKLFFTSVPRVGERVNVSGDNADRHYAVVESVNGSGTIMVTFRLPEAGHYETLKNRHGWAEETKAIPLRA